MIAVRRLLDHKGFRIAFAVIVGLPVTVLSVFGLILALVLVIDNDPFGLVLSLAALLGAIGVVGAWTRIIVSSDRLSALQCWMIRLSMLSGLAACAILMLSFSAAPGAVPLVVLLGSPFIATGVLFLLGT